MTDSEINQAIAEACGWERTDRWTCGWMMRSSEWPDGMPGNIPAFTTDLNAMHEAEAWLESHQSNKCHSYVVKLRHVIYHNGVVGEFRLAHATARQRSEAFLRTLGKWRK